MVAIAYIASYSSLAPLGPYALCTVMHTGNTDIRKVSQRAKACIEHLQ